MRGAVECLSPWDLAAILTLQLNKRDDVKEDRVNFQHKYEWLC